MRTLSIDEILTLGERDPENRPPLENYFSPTKKEAFTKDYLHYLNTVLLDAKHENLDMDQYLVFVLSFHLQIKSWSHFTGEQRAESLTR